MLHVRFITCTANGMIGTENYFFTTSQLTMTSFPNIPALTTISNQYGFIVYDQFSNTINCTTSPQSYVSGWAFVCTNDQIWVAGQGISGIIYTTRVHWASFECKSY